jgi:hypothetical protein
MELVKGQPLEVLAPAERAEIRQVIERAELTAGLSPWERRRIQWLVSRQRGELIVQMARVGAEAVLAEATVTANGRVNAARERAVVQVFAERIACIAEAGELLDAGLDATAGMSEDTGAWARQSMYRAAMSFSARMERGPRAPAQSMRGGCCPGR